MAKIKFDADGKDFYETGVSEGVLFVKNSDGTYQAGVAWNGLSAVTNSPEGAEETAIYADNIKYLSLRSAENFNATIEAYTYPDEFEECDGQKQASSTVRGVKFGQQSRKAFAFCYKTKKGNENDADLGYVIHIIYGCTASPTEKGYETVNDSPSATAFSWSISSIPVAVTDPTTGSAIAGFKPTAHIEIDSTEFTTATKSKLTAIENALYGTDPQGTETEGTDPTLLLPGAIIAILSA